MRLLFDIKAKEQLREIFAYSKEQFGVRHAQRYITEMRERMNLLKQFPAMGNIEQSLTTTEYEYRYIYHKPYKIIYSVKENVIRIHLFWHTYRNPDDLPEYTFGVCESRPMYG